MGETRANFAANLSRRVSFKRNDSTARAIVESDGIGDDVFAGHAVVRRLSLFLSPPFKATLNTSAMRFVQCLVLF
jgi:hypothetical protein